MILSRRKLLIGGGLIIAAPVIVRASSLMQIRGEKLIIPPWNIPPLWQYPYYKLDGKRIVRALDILDWGKWFETHTRHVALEQTAEARVSTVFLGIDHGIGRITGSDPPVLFETMVFGGRLCEEQERYCTWAQAEEGHRRMVERVKALESLKLVKGGKS